MTKKEAIARVRKSGDWTEKEALMIVENEIKKNPDYLGEVKLVDVDKKEKKSKEPKQRQDKLKWKATKVHPGPDTMGDISNMLKALLKSDQIQSLLKGGNGDEDGPTDLKEELREDDASKFDDDVDLENWFKADEEPTEETEEEKLQRQIRELNEMRSHVSDLDEDYLLYEDAPKQEWGPEGKMYDERELTDMVEGLQRRAMQQGNVGAASEVPLGISQEGFPFTPGGPNPYEQRLTQSALQRAQMAGGVPGLFDAARDREGGGLQSRPWEQGMNAQTMQSGVRPLMGIGGGNQSWGAGTWYPYRGNPYGG
jgi:hypothetical protein